MFVWFIREPERILPGVRDLIDEAGRVWVSLVALWEIIIKESTRHPIVSEADAQGWFLRAMRRSGCRLLAIRTPHVGAIQGLPLHHGDPFDRLLVGQATAEEVPIVSADSVLGLYDVEVIRAS